jgi:hypothetical protein
MAAAELKTCPKCKNASNSLLNVDSGLRLALQQNGVTDVPAQVCGACFTAFGGQVSQGVKLRMEQQAKEKNKHMMWKNRVNLIKQARAMMVNKSYSEAAVAYEKYLRILEITYEVKAGGLTPDTFGKTSRSKELTIISTTYWDLMRIYDMSPNYRNRMTVAGRKLGEFIAYSTIFPDVVRKAESFVKTAKNPDIVKEFLRRARGTSGRCFIATVAFENPFDPAVLQLRQWRDDTLLKIPGGQWIVDFYYWISPPIAKWLEHHPRARKSVSNLLRRFAQFTKS